MRAFKITGTFRMGRDIQNFTKEVACKDKKSAEELTFSELGSKHKVKRYDISIDKVEELKPDEISDSVISFKVSEMKE